MLLLYTLADVKPIQAMPILTADTFYRALRGENLDQKDYTLIPDAPVEPAQTIIVNKSGTMYLYMSDDHRQSPPIQIIVKEIGSYAMHFLGIEHKCAIALNYYKP